MRLIIVSAFAVAASGCAIFSGSERTAIDARAAAPLTAASEPRAARGAERAAFRPAFGVGRPVALVPCRNKVTLGDDCRSLNDRHQVAGELAEDLDARPLDEASLRASDE